MLFYQFLFCTTHGKIQRSKTKAINLTYQLQHGMGNLIYLMDCILIVFKGIFNISDKKKKGGEIDNLAIRICINKV